MKPIFLTLVVFFYSVNVFAFHPSLSEQDFCADRKDDLFVKDLLMNPLNLMSFQNHGGLLNRGVCWWHSRFQRNALYLTIFKPQLPKPTEDEAHDLIKAIRSGKSIIAIPGYSYFSEFSKDYENLIQHELEKWQKADGILKFAWINGLSGKSKSDAAKLKTKMDELYEEVEINNTIAYTKLQIPGLDTHAWLVIHMFNVEDGYLVEYLDSMIPNRTFVYKYTYGDRYFSIVKGHPFLPYLEKTEEMSRIKQVIMQFCNLETPSIDQYEGQ
jgi:hypothetical protein